MLELKHAVMSWQRLWSRLPSFTDIPAFEKPTRIATTEELVNEYTGAQLIEIALSNADLYGNAELDPVRVRALSESDVLAMYLNVRYGATPPDHLMPIRRAHAFSESSHLLGWYMLMSAILTKLYDQTRITIDPHLKYRADQLSRVIAQVNWIIRRMIDTDNGKTNPNVLIVGVATITGKTGTHGFILFDEQQYNAWVAAGRTVQQAWDHWQQFKTQPTL